MSVLSTGFSEKTARKPLLFLKSERADWTSQVSGTKDPAERTDDPVRMYLREMGSVELLSREGEIAIAKRIEAAARR